MYDTKSEAHEFIADTEEEARSKAAGFFGVDASELTVAVLPDTTSGLAGRAMVVAQLTEAVGKAPAGGRDDGPRGGRDRDGERSARGDRGGRDRDRGGRGGRGRDRDRGGDRDRDRGRGRRGDRDDREDRGRGDRGGRGARTERVEVELSDEPSVGKAVGTLGPVGDFLLGALERMEVGPFELSETEEDRYLIYQVTGAAADALSAGEARAPDALQLIANQAAGQLFDEPKRIVVDVEGDREKRDALLERIADRAAKRATETGRSVALEPMNSKDRRGIHMALRDEDGIATMSIGEGRYRQVVVVPEGADEWDEAVEASNNG